MKSMTKYDKGTVSYIYNKSNPAARWYVDLEESVGDAVYTNIETIPSTGKNPGNRLDPTNWEYRIRVYRKPVGSIRENWPPGVEFMTKVGVIGLGPIQDLPPWDRSAVYNRALARVNEKAHDQADWAEDVAQGRSTLKNLASSAVNLALKLKKDPLGALRDAPISTKRKLGFEKAIREGVSDVSSGILAYKYVFKPTLLNIFDTANAMLNMNDGGLIWIRGGANQPIEDSGYCAGNSHNLGSAKLVKFKNSGIMGCRFKILMRGLDENRLADFSTLDPRVLAWNLLPYSFVVDWFYGIGAYLEAQEHALRFNPLFVRGYIDELYSCSRVESVDAPTASPGNPNIIVMMSRAKSREIWFKRTKLTSWPSPRRPVLNTDLGSGQLLAAAALLGTILGRKS